MQIFKFGGASINDASGVRNLVAVLDKTRFDGVLVVSAMGKMTNALEAVVDAYFEIPDRLAERTGYVADFHLEICHSLFDVGHPIFGKVEAFMAEIQGFFKKDASDDYDYVYDQVVSFGELMSTCIVSEFLTSQGIGNTLIDVRQLIETNSRFRDAKVDWPASEERIKTRIIEGKLTIIQGFIASDGKGNTTTLGREGSDYTAGILAYCLNAESVSIWKNVDGVLNADPREFDETVLLEQLSYRETIELAFYGASVIHPKTIQPLQRKDIPLFVKSFYNPDAPGTKVGKGVEIRPNMPCFIVKKRLVLLSLSALDFSFIVEENISEIFGLLHKYRIKVDLIQNSAISFSVCVSADFKAIDRLIALLKSHFRVSFNKNVSLYTIRHFDQAAIEKIRADKVILLEQRTRETMQLITK